jgi:copper chaperone CopZ
VQGALESVRGVKDVKVSVASEEAVVTYDAAQTKVDSLIEAVKQARGMSKYDARVKGK